ncbi:MAG TPA: histidine phosphatase family protein [Chloroflexota bacterium]|jgi:broad specificity phosphatase PhoE|nr:histidine phosphatase family protein [Chloroflexota bacterium]
MGRRPIRPAPRSRARPPSAAALLLLVRHAETEDNVAERLSGWTDGDLSQLGEQQVRLLADHFNRAHGQAAAIYASPLTRARRTAEAIGALTGHAPVLLDDLREMHFGELDGRPFKELRESHGHLLEADDDQEAEDFAWPAGESRRGFVARVRRAMDRIARAHPGEAAAVVTHGGVIAMFLATVHGEPVATWRKWIVPNASLTEVEWDPETGTGRLLRHGDAAHLAELTAAETSGRAPSAEC